MALSDMKVFSEYTYTTIAETIAQEIAVFNQASGGTITLASDMNNQGDWSDSIGWLKMSGVVRRRNPYADTSIGTIAMQQFLDTMVKIASGTPVVVWNPSQFTWIQQNPQQAGVVLGQNLAQEMLADMVNTALAIGVAAISAEDELVYDDGADAILAQTSFNSAQAKFGDRYSQIAVWAMHSKPLFDLFGTALANGENLYNFGNVAIKRDAFGRPFLITDSPAFLAADTTPQQYVTLGLVPGAIRIEKNNDFDEALETKTGFENLQRHYQAEWTYNAGIKGFRWNKGTSGDNKAPDDEALADPDNWVRYATSAKDLAGVAIYSQ